MGPARSKRRLNTGAFAALDARADNLVRASDQDPGRLCEALGVLPCGGAAHLRSSSIQGLNVSAFLDRYKVFLSDERVQAARQAATYLAKKHAVTLPPLEMDRSGWSKEVAATLPLRAATQTTTATKVEAAATEKEDDDVDIMALLVSGGANGRHPLVLRAGAVGQRKGPGAGAAQRHDRLFKLLSGALEKYLAAAAAREAEEEANRQRHLMAAGAAGNVASMCLSISPPTTAAMTPVSAAARVVIASPRGANRAGGGLGKVVAVAKALAAMSSPRLHHSPPGGDLSANASQPLDSTGSMRRVGSPTTPPNQDAPPPAARTQPPPSAMQRAIKAARSLKVMLPGDLDDGPEQRGAASSPRAAAGSHAGQTAPEPSPAAAEATRRGRTGEVGRMNATGAVITASAMLGVAPRASTSGAAAAALAVFNAVSDHTPQTRQASRFAGDAGDPAEPGTATFSSPEEDQHQARAKDTPSPQRMAPSASTSSDGSDDGLLPQSQSGRDQTAVLPGKSSPSPPPLLRQGTGASDASSVFSPRGTRRAGGTKPAGQLPRAGSSRSDTKVRIQRPGSRGASRSGGASPRPHQGSPSPAADAWSSPDGVVLLDDEDDEARRRRVSRMMSSRRPGALGSGGGAHRSSHSGGGAGRHASTTGLAGRGGLRSRIIAAAMALPPPVAGAAGQDPGSGVAFALADQSQPREPKEPSRNGVCLAFLQTLAGLVLREVGDAAHQLTTREVVSRYIMPRTPPGDRFLDYLPPATVASPRYHVSYRAAGSFLALVLALTRYFQDQGNPDPDRIFLWLDFLAIDLRTKMDAEDVLILLEEVSKITSHTLMVLDAEGTALNRMWILLEAWCATHDQYPVTNKLIILPESGGLRATPLLTELFTTLDVSRAEARSDEERYAIVDYLRQGTSEGPGSAAQRRLVRSRQSKGNYKKRSWIVALLQSDFTPINKELRAALVSACAREAKRAAKTLTTQNPYHMAFIRYMLMTGVMMHLERRLSEAEALLHWLLEYQLNGMHGSAADLSNTVVALVDALAAQGKLRDAMLVASRVYDTASRLLGISHRVTTTMGLAVWQLLDKLEQHTAAETLALSLYARMSCLYNPTADEAKQMDDWRQAVMKLGHSTGPAHVPGMEVECASTAMALARTCMAADKLPEASALLHQVLKIHEGMLGREGHPRRIEPLLALGDVSSSLGSHGDAVSWYTQARTLLSRWHSRESRLWVYANCAQAAALQAMGDLRIAEKMVRRLMAPSLREKLGVAAAAVVESSAALSQTAAAGGSGKKLGSRNAHNVSPAVVDPELEAEQVEDRRVGGAGFEVNFRLASILAARAVAVALTPEPDHMSSTSRTASGFLGGSAQSQSMRSGASMFLAPLRAAFGAPGGEASMGTGPRSGMSMMGSGGPRMMSFMSASAPMMMDTVSIIQEAADIAAKLMRRFQRRLSAITVAAAAAAAARVKSSDGTGKGLGKGGIGAKADAVAAPNRIGRLRSGQRLPAIQATKQGAQGRRRRSSAAGTGGRGATGDDKGTNAYVDMAAEIEQEEVDAQLLDKWRDLLKKLLVELRTAGLELQAGGELEAALIALKAAVDLSAGLLGAATPACIDMTCNVMDVLMQLQSFEEARDFKAKIMGDPSMTLAALEILHHSIAKPLTEHAFAAVKSDDPDKAVWALDLGASSLKGEDRLLVLAASLGHYESVVAIAQHYPTTCQEEESRNGMRALGMAASLGYEDIVEYLLGHPQVAVEAPDFEGRTALWHTAREGHRSCAELLLVKGRANPGAEDVHRVTPLHIAATCGQLDLVQLLLQHKAAIGAQDFRGRTPLMHAALAGQAASCDLLLRCHAQINTADKDGMTALMHACTAGHYDCAVVLLTYSCDQDVQDSLGQTALMKAASQGYVELVRLLMSDGADVEVTDQEGRGVIHHAAFFGHVPVIVFIIQFIAKGGYIKGVRALKGQAPPNSESFVLDVPSHIRMRVDEVLAGGARPEANVASAMSMVGSFVGSMHSGLGLQRFEEESDSPGDSPRAVPQDDDSDPDQLLNDLKLLQGHARLTNVKRVFQALDRYGLSCAEAAIKGRYIALGRVLKLFVRPPLAAGLGTVAKGGTDSESEATTPRDEAGAANWLGGPPTELLSPRSAAAAAKMNPILARLVGNSPRGHASINGMAVRKSILTLPAEYDV